MSCMSCIWGSTTKSRAKNKVIFLNQLQIYSVLAAQIIASTILLALIIWPLIRIPEPEVHLTRLKVDAVDNSTAAIKSNLLRFSMTLHNPDRYKSLKYDTRVLRITYSKYSKYRGELINYNSDGKSFTQGPGETTLLPDHVVNCTAIDFYPEDLFKLKTEKAYLYFRFIMEVSLVRLNKLIRSRQVMRQVKAYFNDDGEVFLLHHDGLKFD